MDMFGSKTRTNTSNSKDVPIEFTGCFGDYNVTSCVRDSVLSSLAIITAFICAIKLYKLFHNRHSLVNQYIIFLSALLESLLCAINWVYLWAYAVIYVLEFLKIVQCVVVCRFYCALAAQIYRKDQIARFILPGAVTFIVFVAGICISGWATLESDKVDCLGIQWILLSVAEFLNAQFFLISGIFVTKKLNEVRTLDDMRNSKKRELWGSITVFEMTSIASVTHDVIFKVLGEKNGCQGILPTSASGFTAVYIAFKITRWLLPIWAMAALFQIENNTISDESLASLVVTTPTGFKSSFLTRDRSLNRHPHDQSSSSSSNPEHKRLMLPPFLKKADDYGTVNRAGLCYENSDRYDEIAPP